MADYTPRTEDEQVQSFVSEFIAALERRQNREFWWCMAQLLPGLVLSAAVVLWALFRTQ